MRLISTDKTLAHLEERVKYFAGQMGRTLPEIRFFILDQLEFASLLEKHVYPTSPVNIWEGKRMVTKKFRIESGQESALYYEVVQTGNPSYAYLNNTNSAMMQASVMAHVVGHCEFSELNVLKDSNPDRTEYVMYLVKKVNAGQQQMGEKKYLTYWNACESVIPLISPHSQYNLDHSVEGDIHPRKQSKPSPDEIKSKEYYRPFSFTMENLLKTSDPLNAFEKEQQKKNHQEQISRTGFRLYRPCQDILGFLKNYAPTSRAEQAILDYMYVSHSTHDFVIRTQIMNEGWAMYWEKKIMLELFKEKAVKGIIDYSKVFSGVCAPRPFFMRNPYHLGYHLWNHIEELYQKGKVSLDYMEEMDVETRRKWNKETGLNPLECMNHLVRTITDYEFIRRFLTEDLVYEFHLNRIIKQHAEHYGINKEAVVKENNYYVWLDPKMVKEEMLSFFTHFQRPRIYVIDTDFIDGGLLLFHRNDGRVLRKTWIEPTLKNINYIWKSAVSLLSGEKLYSYSNRKFEERAMKEVPFEQVLERLDNNQKPISL
ncbi:SpoVR family protein [bacterium]|nr:SpoVR family protein [bacterium]